MMNMFLGEETFRDGVRKYLKRHKYSNAEQDDLWDSMTKSAHKNKVLAEDITVKQIMDTWTLQTGYPVLTVTRDYNSGSAKLRQKRFLSDRVDLGKAEEGCWWIPLSYTCPSELNFNRTSPKKWMKCVEETKVTGLPDDQWVVFNIKMSGKYVCVVVVVFSSQRSQSKSCLFQQYTKYYTTTRTGTC
jgi:aminopeptidase N